MKTFHFWERKAEVNSPNIKKYQKHKRVIAQYQVVLRKKLLKKYDKKALVV